jgi:hypothetical protein
VVYDSGVDPSAIRDPKVREEYGEAPLLAAQRRR